MASFVRISRRRKRMLVSQEGIEKTKTTAMTDETIRTASGSE